MFGFVLIGVHFLGAISDWQHPRSASSFAVWQQACGVTFQPDSLLFDESLHNTVLRPTQQFLHDYMHLMCVSGVVQTTLFLFLQAMSNNGVGIYKMIKGYIELWSFPSSRSLNIHNLFLPKREKSNKEAQTFKCSASEALAVLPILSHFINDTILRTGVCTEECKAVLAVADVLEILHSTSHGCNSRILAMKIDQVFDQFDKSNWKDFMHSKFHWLLHMPSHIAKFNFLISCWVHERKHRIIKRYSEGIQNTMRYEKSVLVQVVAHDLALLLEEDYFGMHARLKKQCKSSKKVLDFFKTVWNVPIDSCYMCTCAHLEPAGLANRRDVIILKSKDRVGEVWLFAEINKECVALISFWNLLDKKATHSIWNVQEQPELVHTDEIQCSLTYRKLKDGRAIVLLPLECR